MTSTTPGGDTRPRPRPAVADFQSGLSVGDIADKYGVSDRCVREWLAAAGYSVEGRPGPLQLTDEQVGQYEGRQASMGQIAGEVGCPDSQVRQALYRAGVPVRRRKQNTSVLLYAHDQEWLRRYNPHLDLADPAVRSQLNQLIKTGSRHLYKHDPDDVRSLVIAARERFLEQLRISMKAAKHAGRGLLPSNIVINSRLLADHGIDVRKLRKGLSVLGTRHEVLRAMLERLRDTGVEVKKTCEGYPRILTMDPGVFADRFAHMQSRGIRALTVMAHAPQVAVYTKQAFDERIDSLARTGVDAVAVANSHPGVLLRSPAVVSERFRLLAELGLDPVQVVTVSPSIFGQSNQTVTSKVRLIRTLGRLFGDPALTEECLHQTNVLQLGRSKLLLTARLWTTYVHSDLPPDSPDLDTAGLGSAEVDVTLLKRALMVPAVDYIVAVGTDPAARPTVRRLYRDAVMIKNRHSRADRLAMAYDIATSGRLGRIGTQYLRYVTERRSRGAS
jgi:hypothetical protein